MRAVRLIRGVLCSSLCCLLGWVTLMPQIVLGQAQEANREKLLNRCYLQLTGTRLSFSHPFLRRLKTTDVDPIELCLEIVQDLDFENSGLIQNRTSDKAKFLARIHEFHRSWFSVKFPTDYNDLASHEAQDYTMPALYVTQAFVKNKDFQSIFEGNKNLKALRSDSTRTLNRRADRTADGDVNPAPIESDSTNSVLVERGFLNGIREMKSSDFFRYSSYEAEGPQHSDLRNPINAPLNSGIHHGDGILGAPAYFLLNNGHSVHRLSTGGTSLFRRMTKNIMSDLLCRELPVVRLTDVANDEWVQEDAQQSYRNSASCMQCHASIDPLAGVYRNYQTRRLRHVFDRNKHAIIARKISADSNQSIKVMDVKTNAGDNTFHRTSPEGRFFYRSNSGKLVDQELLGTRDLAKLLQTMDDFYICAAKRYYAWLTGVDIQMRDFDDPFNSKLSSEEEGYYSQIQKLGKDLKEHQSLKKLLADIMRSPIYRNVNMRDVRKRED